MSAVTDPVADFLARLRNAQAAGHRYADVPASKLKRAMTQILLEKGFVKNYLNVEDGKQGFERISKPGLREYAGADELPRVKNGLGIAIISTSRGVMSDKEARRVGVGGEVVAHVF
jgi:small subunit ribosomal protein S8